MRHVFVLCLPRSRTVWLTMYLNGVGIKAIHDGWKFAKTAKELRMVMEQNDIVVNVDSTNILFYDEIQEEFPNAKFIKIIRNVKDVKKSLEESYGKGDYSNLLNYSEILKKIDADITVDYDNWTTVTTSAIHEFVIDEQVKDTVWLIQSDDFKVTITNDRIEDDIWAAKAGHLDHIVNKLRAN